MNTRNAVLFLLPTALVCGVTWALYSLSNTHSLWSFIVLCVVNFVVMATVWYAVDHWKDLLQE
jgi:hypothetical protein